MVNAGIMGQNGKRITNDIFEYLHVLLKVIKAKFRTEGTVMLNTRSTNTW